MQKEKQNLIKSVTYLKAAFFALALVTIFSSVSPDNALAQAGVVKANYGSWQLKCGKPPGAKAEKCALVQSVAAEDRPNVGLTVIFLRSIDGKKQLLRVIAPLGVLLPTGLGLKIDEADMGHTQFLKCGKIGCISEVIATDKLIKQFTTGKTAVFIIFQTPEEGIGIPIQLKGFNQGLRSLN